jgi:hypothetical protein
MGAGRMSFKELYSIMYYVLCSLGSSKVITCVVYNSIYILEMLLLKNIFRINL